MSLDLSTRYVTTHWDAEEGALRSGRTDRPTDWRLVREVLVAETDEQAFRYADGTMGRAMHGMCCRRWMFGMMQILQSTIRRCPTTR